MQKVDLPTSFTKLNENCGLPDIFTDYQIRHLGNSVVTDVQFGHLLLVCIKYVALQEVTCGLFRKILHCSYYIQNNKCVSVTF